MAGRETPAVLALPGGTANVLVNEVGRPRGPIQAANSLPSPLAREVSFGLVEFDSGERRYFLVTRKTGLDAAIAAGTPTRPKNRLGLGAYWQWGAGHARRRFPRLRVVSGDVAIKGNRAGSLVVISKSRFYGG